jgi:hypothetical protein
MHGVQVKGAYVSAYKKELARVGLLEAVLERASPPVREALETPPPSSVWIEYAICLEIYRIVRDLRGKSALRALARDGTLHGIAPLMQTFVQGTLRLFGVSPATLFANLTRISAQTLRGADFTYAPITPLSGVLTLTMPGQRDVDPVVWQASAGGLEVVFATCGVDGTVQEPMVVPDGLSNAVEYRVSWKAK